MALKKYGKALVGKVATHSLGKALLDVPNALVNYVNVGRLVVIWDAKPK